MKKLFISLIMVLGFMGSMVAMDQPTPRLRQTGPVALSGNDGQAYEGAITVQTSDDQEFIISKEVAQQMPTLNALMEDIGAEQAIPLPTITGKIFDWIVNNLMLFQNDPNAQIDMQTLRGFTVDELIDLIRACEYLHTDKLLNALFKIFDERGRVIGRSLTSNYIKIITEDNQEFAIPLEVAKQISVIKGMIGDIGELATVIPLPTVKGEAFNWIARTLLMLNENPNAQINTQELSVDQLVDLINAYEYLDLDHLENRLFKVLNERNLFEGNALENINSTALKKFWIQHPAYSYIINLAAQVLSTKSYGSDPLLLAVSEDGSSLAAWNDGQKIIKVWDLNDQNLQPHIFEDQIVTHVSLDKNGSKVVSSYSSHQGTITIWNLYNGEKLFELSNYPFSGFIISPDESKLISFDNRGTITIWDLNTRDRILQLQARGVSGLTISPDGSRLVSWFDGGLIEIWDLTNMIEQPLGSIFAGYIDEVIISADGSKLISRRNAAQNIKIWDMRNFEQLAEFDHPFVRDLRLLGKTKLISFSTTIFNPHPMIREVFNLKIWDLDHLNQAPQYLELEPGIGSYKISKDGSTLVVWNKYQKTIKIWDLNHINQEPMVLQVFDKINEFKLGLLTSDGSKLILYSNEDKEIRVWDFKLLNIIDSLNFDQIKLMMWLYENRNNGNAKLSLELNDAYESLSDNLKHLLNEKFSISKLLKSGIELKPEPFMQQEPEQAQAQLPQLEQPLVPQVPQHDIEQVVPQQEPELVQPQAPQEVQPEGQAVPQQPSLWQRWLNLFRTRLWTPQS